MKHLRRKNILSSLIIKLIIILICLIDIYPIFWMLTASLKQPYEWSTKAAYAMPDGFYFQNYIDAWSRGRMSIFFRNSLVYTLLSLVVIVIFSSTVGFAVTKMDWKLKHVAHKYFQFGIMVPVATALIPLFQIYKGAGLYNTPWSLIISYIAFGLSLSVYLVSGYLRSFPDEIMEAAVIDGCGIYSLMYHVVIPLMKNAIVTVLVLQFFFKWNDLLFSMTFVSDTKLKTIQTGLMYFSDEFGSKNWGAIFASVSISIVPMLVLYTILNKTIIEGMTAGAVKG
jgi:raffinose/stachyose/melibiose transport system permease protein